MITGTVLNRRIALPIPIRATGKPEIVVEFVLDTAFSDHLTLPAAACQALGLQHLFRSTVTLPNDHTIECEVYAARIVWDGVERVVPVWAVGKRPLVGTALLEDVELVAQFTRQGNVTLEDIWESRT